MNKLIAALILVCVLFCTIGLADRAKTGIGGYVYDNNNQLAGSDLDYITIISHVKGTPPADYYYYSGTSYWVTNDVYGLSDGTWYITGFCNGYHSPTYEVEWEFPEWIDQDIHCTIPD